MTITAPIASPQTPIPESELVFVRADQVRVGDRLNRHAQLVTKVITIDGGTTICMERQGCYSLFDCDAGQRIGIVPREDG